MSRPTVNTSSIPLTHVANNDFTPSQYATKLTMDGTAQVVALATGTTKLFIVRTGTTTQDTLVAPGTSSANAETNLGLTGGPPTTHATTGEIYIPSPADGYGSVVIGVAEDTTHVAVANATSGDAHVVWVMQGV